MYALVLYLICAIRLTLALFLVVSLNQVCRFNVTGGSLSTLSDKCTKPYCIGVGTCVQGIAILKSS